MKIRDFFKIIDKGDSSIKSILNDLKRNQHYIIIGKKYNFLVFNKEIFPIKNNIVFLINKGEVIEKYKIDGGEVFICDNGYFLIPNPEINYEFGVIELLEKDKYIQDIYVDSNSERIYINHEKYGILDTNLFISEEEKEILASKLRAITGRPFDISSPVLEANYKDLRITLIREPLTFKGIGIAVRRHKKEPWTLNEFLKKDFLNREILAYLKLILEAKKSILITGPRGSGKTSLLMALINELDKNRRIVIVEDTKEIPSEYFVEKGYKIEHLKVTSPIFEYKFEMKPEEALRTALRLGESVLVIGEVRGKEAKVLFEAMRIGAAGDSVLGTIHGSSEWDTFDRIVYDLGVPPSSFKSVDVIVCLGFVNNKRKIISISELKKNWREKPQFIKIFEWNYETDKYINNIEKSLILSELEKKKINWRKKYDKILSKFSK